MEFRNAYFRLNERVTLNKGDIKSINGLLTSVYSINDVNKNIMRDILLEEDGIKIPEYKLYVADSTSPFLSTNVYRNGKEIGSIYINYRQPKKEVELA